MQSWTPFFAATGGASAALLGLLFVAVSVNVSATLGPQEPLTRRLAEQAFHNYLIVMLLSFLGLFPAATPVNYGRVTAAVTLASCVWVVIRLSQALSPAHSRTVWVVAVRRHASSLLAFGLLSVSGICLALNWADAYRLLAGSALVLLFAATSVSWQLLSSIARREG